MPGSSQALFASPYYQCPRRACRVAAIIDGDTAVSSRHSPNQHVAASPKAHPLSRYCYRCHCSKLNSSFMSSTTARRGRLQHRGQRRRWPFVQVFAFLPIEAPANGVPPATPSVMPSGNSYRSNSPARSWLLASVAEMTSVVIRKSASGKSLAPNGGARRRPFGRAAGAELLRETRTAPTTGVRGEDAAQPTQRHVHIAPRTAIYCVFRDWPQRAHSRNMVSDTHLLRPDWPRVS